MLLSAGTSSSVPQLFIQHIYLVAQIHTALFQTFNLSRIQHFPPPTPYAVVSIVFFNHYELMLALHVTVSPRATGTLRTDNPMASDRKSSRKEVEATFNILGGAMGSFWLCLSLLHNKLCWQ